MQSNQPQPNKFTYPLEIRQVEEDILFTSPDGWLQSNIKYVRSKLYGGVIRSFSLPVKYVERGAYLVRREFYKYGLLARINQKILSLNTLTWVPEQLFFGKLDFSTWSDEPTGVSVTLTENNINVQVAAYGDQQYSVPLNIPTQQRNAWIAARGYDPMVDILLTPLKLEETADFIFATTPDFRMNAFFSLQVASYQQMSVNPSVQGTGFLWQGPPTFAPPAQPFFTAQTDTKIRINSPLDPLTGLPSPGGVQTSINGPAGGGTGQYQFNIYNQHGTLLKTLAESPPVISTVEFTFDFDFSFNLSKGDMLYFYILNVLSPTIGVSDTNHGVNMQSGAMSLTYFTSTPASHCQALRPAYVFDYLVQRMNGTENPTVVTQSRLLDSPLFQACITCSNAILTSQVSTIYQAGDNLQVGSTYRVLGGIITYVNTAGNVVNFGVGSTFVAVLGFPTFTTAPDQDGFVQQENNNPQLLLSFNTFFKAIYGVQGAQAGVGIDPTVQGRYCLEDLRYFYRQTPASATPNQAALDLGINIDVKSPRLEVGNMAVNAIKSGYEDPQLTALNGNQEVNSSVQYGTDITSPVATLDITSPINASCYAIEERRIQPGFNQPSQGLSGTFYLNSAASRSDNDNHFVYVKPMVETGGWYQPLTVQDGCSSWQGVDGSFYNWKLTPKQNLLRGRNYLASIFDMMAGYTITLTQAKKNASLVTVDAITGERVSESDAVNISDLGPQIFLPYFDNITTGLVFNAEAMLSSNPFGEIWYMYRGVNWKAFIQEVGVDKGSNSPQSFKVLLTPANDWGGRVF